MINVKALILSSVILLQNVPADNPKAVHHAAEEPEIELADPENLLPNLVTPHFAPDYSNIFTKDTGKIVNDHMYDFNVYNFQSKMKSYGGYENYLKSLGGVFAKYVNFTGKVETVKEFQEVAEYVWGIMTIWGFDYANYQPSHYGKWRADDGVGDDAFYPSGSDNGKVENQPQTGIDRVASGGGVGMTVNCNNGVDWLLRKAGLFNSSTPATYDLDKMHSMSMKTITNASDLQPGDIIQYFTSSGANPSNWWGKGYFHINIVGERNESNGTITEYDSGHYYTDTGRYKYTRSIGQWPYEWAESWVGERLFTLRKTVPIKWLKAGTKWQLSKDDGNLA